jgi:hypothetical protein
MLMAIDPDGFKIWARIGAVMRNDALRQRPMVVSTSAHDNQTQS